MRGTPQRTSRPVHDPALVPIVADGTSGDSLGAMLLAREAVELIEQADQEGDKTASLTPGA
jgi:hypothetical protein